MFLGIMYLDKGSFHSVRTSVRINEANEVFLGHIHLKKMCQPFLSVFPEILSPSMVVDT